MKYVLSLWHALLQDHALIVGQLSNGIPHTPRAKALIASEDGDAQCPHIDTTGEGWITIYNAAAEKSVEYYGDQIPIEQVQRAHMGITRERLQEIRDVYGARLVDMCAPMLQPKEDLLEG